MSDQITITRIELFQVAMVPAAVHAAAHGTIGQRNVILARVWDSDGASGWGECVAFPAAGYLRETVDTAWTALRNGVAPAVIGRSFDGPIALAEYLKGAMPHNPVASATVEMAAWDMMARRQQRSLANLIGGIHDWVPAGATVAVLDHPEQLAQRVAAAAATGYKRIKVKIDPSRALTVAREAVSAAGAVPIVADANGSFPPGETQTLRELDAAGLAWIEQPYGPASLKASSDLRDQIMTPIALDESVTTVDATDRIIEHGAAAAVVIKPGRVGGITASLEIYRKTRAAGLRHWIGGMLETGVGRAHNLALASLAGSSLPGDMGPSSAYWARDILTEPIEMVDGTVAVPEGPGIGVNVSDEYLRAATVAREVFG